MYAFKRLAFNTIFLAAMCILEGCASLAGTFQNDSELDSKMYIGTLIDAKFIGTPFRKDNGLDSEALGFALIMWPFAVIDLPLSFVMDTVFLPYTISYKSVEHESLKYYEQVTLKGSITTPSRDENDSYLIVSPSINVLDGNNDSLNMNRVTAISLELKDKEKEQIKKFITNFEFPKEMYIKGVLYPPDKNRYVRMKVMEFQNAP